MAVWRVKLETNRTSFGEASWEATDNDPFAPAVAGGGPEG